MTASSPAVPREAALETALRLAIRQNSHDMLMTGEELRQCRAALQSPAGQASADGARPAEAGGGAYEAKGYALAMRVLQSDLYRALDDRERAECDELIRIGQGAPEVAAPAGEQLYRKVVSYRGLGVATATYVPVTSPASAPTETPAAQAASEAEDFLRKLALIPNAVIRSSRDLSPEMIAAVRAYGAWVTLRDGLAFAIMREGAHSSTQAPSEPPAAQAASEPRAPVLPTDDEIKDACPYFADNIERRNWIGGAIYLRDRIAAAPTAPKVWP